jgi:two-component system, NtrC family, sensor histidine kinase HydH
MLIAPLTMDEVRSAESRMLRRTIIMSLIVLVIGTLAFVFLVAQQNYQVMEQRYRSFRTYTGNILAQMRDGVITVDPAGKVTIVNARAAEILGVHPEEIEGRMLKEIEGGGANVMKEVFGGADGTIEKAFALPGNESRIVEVSVSTIHDAGEAGESRSAVFRDVTEARRLEREAQRTSKLTAMGELASEVAHEIRNPLNAIAMIAQRFAKEFTPRRGVKEFHTLTTVMQDETRRVNTIIRQFLSFARPPKIHCREINLPDLINAVASLFASQAKEKGVAFTASAAGTTRISLDPEQIKQALLNLLQNALDATRRGGRIVLSAVPERHGARIVVEDNGIGMSAAAMEKSFDPYHTTKPHGVGLGLPITQQIITRHGGTIDVSSVKGKGTVFTVRIPGMPVA